MDVPYVKPVDRFCQEECLCDMVQGKLQCKCGESNTYFEWNWAENDNPDSNIRLSNENRDVLFHPVYSAGTAFARGSHPLEANRHHFWEVKMVSHLYGTDVMVGVSTLKSPYPGWHFKYCSYLGIDEYSWGYSYIGNIQHNGHVVSYGPKFDVGCLVGIHVDMYQGTIEYLVNRKRLGIAHRNLKDKSVYPMVSSTAAQSVMRLTNAVSCEMNLQMMCLEKVYENEAVLDKYKSIPNLTRQMEIRFPWITTRVDYTKSNRKRYSYKATGVPKRRCYGIPSFTRSEPRIVAALNQLMTDVVPSIELNNLGHPIQIRQSRALQQSFIVVYRGNRHFHRSNVVHEDTDEKTEEVDKNNDTSFARPSESSSGECLPSTSSDSKQ